MRRFFTSIFFAVLFLNIYAQSAICEQTSETGNHEDVYPIVTKKCRFENIQTITTGTADYTGRYDSQRQLLFNEKEVNTSDIFNKKQDQLLKILNEKFQAEFEKLKKDPSNNDCMGAHTFKTKKMNDLCVEFDDDKIKFICDFHLGLRCGSLNDGIVTLKIKEVKKYFKN